MRKFLSAAVAGLTLAGGRAGAQALAAPTCPPGLAQDACQQAYDLFQFMAPQLGISLAGGNATLGQGGAMGGIGHFSVGIRGNVVSGLLPDVTNYTQSLTGARRSTLATNDQILGLPTADAAIGVYKGFPLGLTNVGGVDLLVSATYVPTIDDDNFSITPSKNLQFGYGARVGLLQESLVVPGVSVTYLKRDLPETDLIGRAGSNTLSVTKRKVNTSAWRLVASKSFIFFGIAGGVGQDTYDQSATIAATVTSPVTATTSVPNAEQTMKRTNYFLDLSINLPLFKLVGEVGQVSGGSAPTYNSFSGGSSDRSLTYFSAGLRLAF